MKTDDLIAMLASDTTPVAPHAARKRFQTALLLGGLGAFALMLLNFGVRPDLLAATALPMFWIKLAFPLAIAVPALVLSASLCRPGIRLGSIWKMLPLPWLVIAAMALWALAHTAPESRWEMVAGKTWITCALSITFISGPVLLGVFWAMKGLAPTRPALAGASAGLLSAAVGTLVYALHCPEMQAPFLAIWYLLGMLIPTALGALIGKHLLRW